MTPDAAAMTEIRDPVDVSGFGKDVDAGFDEIDISQVGADQEGFFQCCTSELAPLLER